MPIWMAQQAHLTLNLWLMKFGYTHFRVMWSLHRKVQAVKSQPGNNPPPRYSQGSSSKKVTKDHKTMRSLITAPLFFLFYDFAYAISITPCAGREKDRKTRTKYLPTLPWDLRTSVDLKPGHFNIVLNPANYCGTSDRAHDNTSRQNNLLRLSHSFYFFLFLFLVPR